MYGNSKEDRDESGPSTVQPRDLHNEARSPQARDKSYPHEEMWRRLTGHTWDSKMKQKMQMSTTENVYPNDEFASKSFDDDSRSELAAMEHIRQHILGQTGCGVLGGFQHGFDMDAFESASWMKIVMQFLQSNELKRAVRSWMSIPIMRRGGGVPVSDESDAESVCSRVLPDPIDGKSTVRDTMDEWKAAISREISQAYRSQRNFPYSWREAKDYDALFRDEQVQVDSHTKNATQSPKEENSDRRNRKASRSCHAIVQPHSREVSTGTIVTQVDLPENATPQRVILFNPASITSDWNGNPHPSPTKPTHQNSEPQVSQDLGFQQMSHQGQTEQQVEITNAMVRSRIANHSQGTYLHQGTTDTRPNVYHGNPVPHSLQAHTLQTAKENTSRYNEITTSKSHCAGFPQQTRTQPTRLVTRATSMVPPESTHNEMPGRNRDNTDTEEVETSPNRSGVDIQDKDVFTSVAGAIPSSETSVTRNTQTSAHLIENRRLRHWGPGVSQSVSFTTRPAQTGPVPITQKKALTNATSVQTLLASRERKSDHQNNPKENCSSQTTKPLVLKIPINSDDDKDNSSQKNGAPTTIQRTIIQTIISKLRKGETGLRAERVSYNPDSKVLLQKHSITRKLKPCASNICNTVGSKGNLKTTFFRYNTMSNHSPKRDRSADAVSGHRAPSCSASTESTAFVRTGQKGGSTSHGASQTNISGAIKERKSMRSISIPRKLQRLRCSNSLSNNGTQTTFPRGISSRALPLYEQRRMLAFLPVDSSTGAETVNLIPPKITPQTKDKNGLGGKIAHGSSERNKAPFHTAGVHNEESPMHLEVKNKMMPHMTTSVPKNKIFITKHTLSVPIKMSSSLVHAQRLQYEVNKNPVKIKEIPSDSLSKVPSNTMVSSRNQLKRQLSPHHSRKLSYCPHKFPELTKSPPFRSCGRNDFTSCDSRGSESPEAGRSGSVTLQSSGRITSGISTQDMSPISTGYSSVIQSQSPTPMDSSTNNTPMRSACTSPIRLAVEDKKVRKPPPSPSEALKPSTASVQPEKCIKDIKLEHQTATGRCQEDSKPAKEKVTKCESPSMCNQSRQLAEHVLSVLQKQREYVESHFNKLAETCETLISESTAKEDSEEQLKKVANICRNLLKVTSETRSPKPERFDLTESEEESKSHSGGHKHHKVEERERRSGDELKENTKQKHATSAGCTRNSPAMPSLPQVPPPFVCIPPNDELIPQSLDPSALPSMHSTRVPCPHLSSYSRLDHYNGLQSNLRMMRGDTAAYGWFDEPDFAKRPIPASWVLDVHTDSNPSSIRIKEEPREKGSGYGSASGSTDQNQSRTSSNSEKSRPTSILKKSHSRASGDASRESSGSRESSRAQSRGSSKASSKSTNKAPSKSTKKMPSKSTNKAPSKSESKSLSRSSGTKSHSMTSTSPSKGPSVSSSATSSKESIRAPSRTSNKAPSRASSKAPSRASSKAPSRASSKAPSRASSKASSKAPSTVSGRAPSRASSKASSKAPSTVSGRAPSRASGKAPSTASGRPSSRTSSGSRDSSRAQSAESIRVSKSQKRSTGDTSLKSKKSIESKRSIDHANSQKMSQQSRMASQRRNESSTASQKQPRQLSGTAARKQSRQISDTASRNRVSRHTTGRSTSKASVRSSTRTSKRNEPKSTTNEPKVSTRPRANRGNQRREKTSAMKGASTGASVNRHQRERSPSTKKRLLEEASDSSSSAGRGYRSRKRKGECICKRAASSSQESLDQAKCAARCASRGADPMGRRTPCGLRSYQERQERHGKGPNAGQLKKTLQWLGRPGGRRRRRDSLEQRAAAMRRGAQEM